MRLYSVLTPVDIQVGGVSRRFPTAVTVVRTGSDLAVIDTGFPESSLADRLLELGLDPLDFTLVLNTHYHVDHFGGNYLFRNARKILSRAEYEYQHRWHEDYLTSTDRTRFVMGSFPRLGRREAEKLVEFLDVVKNRYFRDDYFGPMESARFIEDEPPLPGWLELFSTPGHTPHHVSCLLRGPERQAIVAGDLVASRSGYMLGRTNFIEVYTDYPAAQRSMEEIRCRAERPGTLIYPSHEGPFHADDGRPVRDNPLILR
jgi:glyoxylase-like metal-dependent hydrolase (beta-lactamase superfamily II)